MVEQILRESNSFGEQSLQKLKLKNIELELDIKHLKVAHERRELELIQKINALESAKNILEGKLESLENSKESGQEMYKLDMEIKLHEAERQQDEIRSEAQHEIQQIQSKAEFTIQEINAMHLTEVRQLKGRIQQLKDRLKLSENYKNEDSANMGRKSLNLELNSRSIDFGVAGIRPPKPNGNHCTCSLKPTALQKEYEKLQFELERTQIDLKLAQLNSKIANEKFIERDSALKTELKFVNGKLAKTKSKLYAEEEFSTSFKRMAYSTRNTPVKPNRNSSLRASPLDFSAILNSSTFLTVN